MAPTTQSTDSETQPISKARAEPDLSFCKALNELRQVQYYWNGISASKAKRLLTNLSPGTFLLRDSRSDHYFFSFSYQTTNGVFHTHVALHKGFYCLGGPNSLIRSSSLIDFVEKAMKMSKDKANFDILMHPTPSRIDEVTAEVDIQFPLNRCSFLPSLKHLCRIVIRHSITSDSDIKTLPLPNALQRYLSASRYLSPV